MAVMIDIETVGTTPNAGILSIGAAIFELGDEEPSETFYHVVDLKTCFDKGLEASASTLGWWMKQSKEAQAVFSQATSENEPQPSLRAVLVAFGDFFRKSKTKAMWAKGTSFDCSIVGNAYNKCGLKIPWQFWLEKDVRTLLDVAKKFTDYKPPQRNGVAHNALDDVLYQIKDCAAAYKALNDRFLATNF